LLIKINRGHGTLGKLANDESLYDNIDSVAINLSRLLEDIRREPKKYIRELKVSMF
jgi:phospholipid/cholesterol/gamma-HCH transport system substrate-binding protein